MRYASPLPLFGILVLLVACNGGGGGEEGFSVGGNVSGLDGTLVLQINGGHDVTVTQNGTFAFQTGFTAGSAYAVSVRERPVHQNCAIANGTGTVAAGGFRGVAVTCTNKVWTHPASVADDITLGARYFYNEETYSGAMDPLGNTIVTWRQEDSMGGSHVYLREYRNGAWTGPADSDDYISPGTSAEDPKAAMAANGEAVLAWTGSVFLSEYRNGQWTHPADENDTISPGGSSATSLQAAMAANGDVVVVWVQRDGTTDCGGSGCYHILLSEYRNGQWTHPADFGDAISPTGTSAYAPRVAMDASGDAVIIWGQEDGSLNCSAQGCAQLLMSEYRNGQWTHPADVGDHINPTITTTEGALRIYPYGVAMGDNGDAIVAWAQGNSVLLSEYRNGLWSHPADLDDAINPSVADAFIGVAAAMNRDGEALVAWTQPDGTTDCNGNPCGQIFLSEHRGGVWTHPADLNDHISPPGAYASWPQVVMDGRGQALVVWRQDDGTTACAGNPCGQIFVSEYRKGAWTHPADLSDNISLDGRHADQILSPAMSDSGDAIIVWSADGDMAPDHVFVSEFR